MFVKDVTMTIADGEFVAVVGRSGSGKTTLMGLLGALEQPTNGMIVVDEQDVTRLPPGEIVRFRQRKIGFVFQSFHLISNLTAVENVMLPRECIGVAKADRKKRAIHLLKQVELTGEAHHRKPGRLSGGEQQRVAIARSPTNLHLSSQMNPLAISIAKRAQRSLRSYTISLSSKG
jgi:putative ABC transport system ATP-binding protein